VRLKNGPVIEARRRVAAVSRNDPVSIMFRPEKAVLLPFVEAGRFANRIPGNVTESVFLGDSVTYGVALATGQLLTVKQTHGPEQVRTYDPGQEMEVCWHPQDTHVFTDTERV
jgi:ABC-type Fe3+/spermidine/putrescine transport system ATPase subunit